jgi:hypothetical protein
MSLHNISRISKSQDSYEYPAVFLPNTLPFSFRTPCSFHYDHPFFVITKLPDLHIPVSSQHFAVKLLTMGCQSSLRTSGPVSFRTSGFLLYFIDFCHWEFHSEHPVFFLMSGDRNGLSQPEFVMEKWDET